MLYIKLIDGTPELITLRQVVRQHKVLGLSEALPRADLLAALAPLNVFPLEEDTAPAYNKNTQTLTKNDPQFIITDVPASGDGEWRVTWTVTDLTTPEIDAKITQETDAAFGMADRQKAIGFTLADIWQQINPTLTTAQARAQVRNRLEANLKEVKGL